MTTAKTQVVNATGLHARPAAIFVKKAKEFQCDIQIRNATKDTPFVNAKSILRLLTAELCKDNVAEIQAQGSDEAEAVSALVALIQTGFGE